MSAHTPGPWAVEIEDGYVCIVSGGITIAEVDGGEAEYIDNAKLLAAAPDLLHALQWSEQFNRRIGESYLECFERIADVFYRQTGRMRPGKDASPCAGASTDEREAAWDAWIAEGIVRTRAAIAKATRGQP